MYFKIIQPLHRRRKKKLNELKKACKNNLSGLDLFFIFSLFFLLVFSSSFPCIFFQIL